YSLNDKNAASLHDKNAATGSFTTPISFTELSDGRQIECWFLKFQSAVGIGSACNRTGHTANPRLWVRRVFPASVSCLSCVELGAPSECGGRAANAFTASIS